MASAPFDPVSSCTTMFLVHPISMRSVGSCYRNMDPPKLPTAAHAKNYHFCHTEKKYTSLVLSSYARYSWNVYQG
ncbi:hypothetical protein CPB86DRAFT_257834 [Serendipita vermifera]|nr:hypothetical protein CPB86DRAFT_257834 [Serendipita vermifera]